MPFEKLDLLFDEAEKKLQGDAHPLDGLKAMHELLKGFHEYLEEKFDAST